MFEGQSSEPREAFNPRETREKTELKTNVTWITYTCRL